MRITKVIPSFGVQMTIIGSLLIICGFVVQFYQAGWSFNINTSTLVFLLLAITGIIGGIYLYQRLVFAKQLREKILRAETITTQPTSTYKKLPVWLWIPLFIFIFTIAACSYIMAFLFGAILIGFGLSVPVLMHVLHELERNGAEYYGQRNPTNGQFEITRFMPSQTDD